MYKKIRDRSIFLTFNKVPVKKKKNSTHMKSTLCLDRFTNDDENISSQFISSMGGAIHLLPPAPYNRHRTGLVYLFDKP